MSDMNSTLLLVIILSMVFMYARRVIDLIIDRILSKSLSKTSDLPDQNLF